MVLGFLSIDVGAHQTSAWRTVELISLAVVAASLALQSYALCVRGREWMVRLREK
jgi:isoprenylcysteine carboxyl methyltransferase (ICMT) family protein YpbQ